MKCTYVRTRVKIVSTITDLNIIKKLLGKFVKGVRLLMNRKNIYSVEDLEEQKIIKKLCESLQSLKE